MLTKHLIQLNEYYNNEVELDTSFTDEETSIIENEFQSKIEIFLKPRGKFFIKTYQYVGYIVLPNHIISIKPKIPKISFFNMIKYALDLPELNPEEFELSEKDNYYDLLVLFLFELVEKLLQRGLNCGYKKYEENVTNVKGKILFKENLNVNYSRPDKMYCSFSEISQDILENRIVKYTIYYLSQCYFVDETINAKLLHYYKLLDHITLVTISIDDFSYIEYTPVNGHYRTILTICELLLKDSSIDEENIGQKTAISFLIDMNRLFEKFVVNLLKEKFYEFDTNFSIEEQKKEFADTQKELELKLDILINYYKKPLLILDTKYKEFESKIDSNHLAQMNLYSDVKKVNNCGLIFPGNSSGKFYNLEKLGLKLHVLFVDLKSETQLEFNNKCNLFFNSLKDILKQFESSIL